MRYTVRPCSTRPCSTADLARLLEVSNHGAYRLYQRLGYRDWGHGLVTDYWDETAPGGTARKTHADSCHYLTKSVQRHVDVR